MNKNILIILSGLLSCHFVTQAQSHPVVIAELTMKIGSMAEEQLHYGFARGDEIIVSFEELKGKPLKEFEILAHPSRSIFLEYGLPPYTAIIV